jgi:hypothetical protein
MRLFLRFIELESTNLQSNLAKDWQTPSSNNSRGRTIFHGKLVKTPPKRNDIESIEQLWKGALAILNADDRDWKQMLPRDLDDLENDGREHIRSHLSMVTLKQHLCCSVMTNCSVAHCRHSGTCPGSFRRRVNVHDHDVTWRHI